MQNIKRNALLLLAASTALIAPEAFAQVAAPDTTATVDYLELNGPIVIAAIGGVMLTLAGVAVLFKWAKASVFG